MDLFGSVFHAIRKLCVRRERGLKIYMSFTVLHIGHHLFFVRQPSNLSVSNFQRLSQGEEGAAKVLKLLNDELVMTLQPMECECNSAANRSMIAHQIFY